MYVILTVGQISTFDLIESKKKISNVKDLDVANTL